MKARGALQRFLMEAAIIMVVALTAGFLSYLLRGDGGSAPPVAVSNTAVLTGPRMVDVDTAAQWFAGDSAVFIDARDKYDYAENHIPGAIHLDAQDPNAWMLDIYHSLPQESSIVTYADTETEESARMLAERLSELGFPNVYYLTNGWRGWLARGLPVNDTLVVQPGEWGYSEDNGGNMMSTP